SRNVLAGSERAPLVPLAGYIGDHEVLDPVVRVSRPWDEVVHLTLARVHKTSVAVETLLALDLPEAGPHLDGGNALRPEEELLQPRVLELVQKRHHGTPAAVDQGPQEAVELEQILGDAGLEVDAVVKGPSVAGNIAVDRSRGGPG